MTTATAIYRSIMLEVERQRVALGIPMWQVDDMAGTQDGYYAKALHADSTSGRQARWDTLQLIVSALFPEGFDCILRARPGEMLDALSMKRKIKEATASALHQQRPLREYMAALGRKGAQARQHKIPAKRRSAIARRAARAKWRQRRKKVSEEVSATN
jgi:hypothetical protein